MDLRKPLDVLIVEDNPGDAFLISEIVENIGLPIQITLAKNGQIALDILGDKDDRPDDPIPDLVILDLNLPMVHGFDVLKRMKQVEKMRPIRVIVMTGSLRKEDEVKARDLGATDYCIKPATVDEMERIQMCLRGQLDLISKNKVKDKSSGSSASWDMVLFMSYTGDQRIPLSYNEMFIMDHLNNGSWNIWK